MPLRFDYGINGLQILFMNQVKTGVVLNYVIIGLNTMLGLLYTPYMLRMLGQNEYGLYSLVASFYLPEILPNYIL